MGAGTRRRHIARLGRQIKGGVRVGNWLSGKQARKLLNPPAVTTKEGLRDRAMLAVPLGCGLRRSEVAVPTLKYIQQPDNRWCIVDLVGKRGRVRTVPVPTWVKLCDRLLDGRGRVDRGPRAPTSRSPGSSGIARSR